MVVERCPSSPKAAAEACHYQVNHSYWEDRVEDENIDEEGHGVCPGLAQSVEL